MADDPKVPEINSEDVSAGQAEAAAPEVSDSQSSSAEVAAPPPPVAEPPAAFLRLKAYCDRHKLKSEMELNEVLEVIGVEF